MNKTNEGFRRLSLICSLIGALIWISFSSLFVMDRFEKQKLRKPSVVILPSGRTTTVIPDPDEEKEESVIARFCQDNAAALIFSFLFLTVFPFAVVRGIGWVVDGFKNKKDAP